MNDLLNVSSSTWTSQLPSQSGWLSWSNYALMRACVDFALLLTRNWQYVSLWPMTGVYVTEWVAWLFSTQSRLQCNFWMGPLITTYPLDVCYFCTLLPSKIGCNFNGILVETGLENIHLMKYYEILSDSSMMVHACDELRLALRSYTMDND